MDIAMCGRPFSCRLAREPVEDAEIGEPHGHGKETIAQHHAGGHQDGRRKGIRRGGPRPSADRKVAGSNPAAPIEGGPARVPEKPGLTTGAG